MAESNSHKWGQILGNFVQDLIYEQLLVIAQKNNLYLDYQKERKARGRKKKVSWKDKYGNSHDLDYVLEKDGTEEIIGTPIVFIEVAWRRYTKHSRNKVQEIEGALIPLADTYSYIQPFLGVVLAGVFTQGSLEQLSSKGFQILYINYNSIIESFSTVEIDASFNEETPEFEFQEKILKWNNLSNTEIKKIKDKLQELEQDKITNFLNSLQNSLARKMTGVIITILHGNPKIVINISQAIEYIENYSASLEDLTSIAQYEVQIKYNNGDNIKGIFQSQVEAIKFLRTFI